MKRLLIALLALLLLCESRAAEIKVADLVDVQKRIPGVVLDIRYATTNNFTGNRFTPRPAVTCESRQRTSWPWSSRN